MIKVLVVEDSPTARELLVYVINSESPLQVVGTACSGEEALKQVARLKPDIISMDINMPGINGFDTTKKIMETHPIPIVIVSGIWDPKDVETAFLSIEAGALAVVQRPAGIGHPLHTETAVKLTQTLKTMAEVKVVTRRKTSTQQKTTASPAISNIDSKKIAREDIELIAIGASTGGPAVLQTILSLLPKNFSVPLVIVQHMSPGFIQGFADWMAQTSNFNVSVAKHGGPLLPGQAYIAPDAFQMGVSSRGRMLLNNDNPVNGLKPSVSFLFSSVANSYGPKAVGVLLSGMGTDGAAELKLLKDKGAQTIIQDQESSVVYGMPGAALKIDAAKYVLSPEKIANLLVYLVEKA